MTIVRDVSADLIVNAVARKLSRVNSRILLKSDTIQVSDAGSPKGSYANSVPVGEGKAQIINEGNKLWIGSFE